MLEIGCGNGSNVIPLARLTASVSGPVRRVFASDVSEVAVRSLSKVADYDPCTAGLFVWDITKPYLPSSKASAREGSGVDTPAGEAPALLRPSSSPSSSSSEVAAATSAASCTGEGDGSSADHVFTPAVLPAEGVDLVMVSFVLSALPPGQMEQSFAHLAAVLKPGGLLCFRDYGAGDMKQASIEDETGKPARGALKDAAWLGGRCFRRNDCTLTYFFSAEEVHMLGLSAGLEAEPFVPAGWDKKACKQAEADSDDVFVQYHTSMNKNRKTGLAMPRVTVAAVFRKPL